MDRADRVGIGGIDDVHPRADHVGGGSAKLLDRGEDDREAAPRLRGGVAGGRGAVGLDRRRARNEDAIARAKRAGEAVRCS